ncbi:MAG: RcpC/CpaB family pilus assembly protein [Pseudoflavonifractor sp.]|nr:RcpC/CpaB family pilus assembly protein [Pseudoflavonifractor sp.]
MFSRSKKASTKELVQGDASTVSEQTPDRDRPAGKRPKKEKEPKPPKGERKSAKEVMTSKKFLGGLCLTAGLLIAFVAAPLVQAKTAALAPVVVLTQNAPVGTKLTDDMLRVDRIGAAGIPDGALTDPAEASGKYIAAAGLSGDILTAARVTDQYPTEDPELLDLPDGKVAMAVALDSLEQSVASKLRAGDVIQLFATLNNSMDVSADSTALVIPELQAVEVLSVTNSKAATVDDSGGQENGSQEDRQISTVVLAVNERQAAILAGLSANAKLHAALVVRGGAADQEKALAAQNNYFAAPEESDPAVSAAPDGAAPVESTDGTAPTEEGGAA